MQLNIFYLPTREDCRVSESDPSLGRIFHRASIDLAAGHILFPIRVYEYPAIDRKGHIHIGANHSDLFFPFQPIYQDLLLLPDPVPFLDWVITITEGCAVDIILKLT